MERASAVRSFLWGAIITLLTFLLVDVTAFVDFHHLGIGALPTGVIMAAPLALLCGGASVLLSRSLRRTVVRWRFLLGLALGAVLGSLWALILSEIVLFLDAHTLVGLLLAGAFGVASGSASPPARRARSRLLEGTVLCGLALSLGLSYDTLEALLPGHQRLTVAFVRWTPGTKVARDGEWPGLHPNARMVEALAKAGLGGRLEFTSIAEHGRGRAALAIIVLERPLRASVKLPEPDGNAIVYVQQGVGFQTNPAGARTRSRFIELDPGPDAMRYTVHLTDGSVQNGTAMSWSPASGSGAPP